MHPLKIPGILAVKRSLSLKRLAGWALVLSVVGIMGWFLRQRFGAGTDVSLPLLHRRSTAGRPADLARAEGTAVVPGASVWRGGVAVDQLRRQGQEESLAAAFQAARHAVEKLDPNAAVSRGADYFAANAAQQLRAWFGAGGMELASGLPALEGLEPWSMKVRLRTAGRTEASEEVSGRSIRGSGNRVEMSSPDGTITEWYENRPEGIEQGFTIAQPPPGKGAIELVLGLTGTVRPAADGVRLLAADGAEVVSVSGLKAWDASGRELAARMEARNMELALLVDDAGARYPITIDPFFANVEKRLLEDTGQGSEFGWSVALNSDTAVVGASRDDGAGGVNAGAAYVFVRSGTAWGFQGKLTANDGQAGDFFGISVSVNGNTALVGANVDGTAAGREGSAYVFIRSGTAWSQQARLTASDGEWFDHFGSAVAVHGDTALVGREQDSTTSLVQGSAYVFVRSGTTWSEQAKLTASDGASADFFGISVALENGTAVVGAFGDNDDAGSAYVFVRSGSTWSQQARLAATGGQTGDRFGLSVAISGESVAIGAVANGLNSGSPVNGGGAAYVFLRTGTSWGQQAMLTASDRAVNDNFGASVSMSGNSVLVGAPGDSTPAGEGAGSAYLFLRSGSSWSQQAKLAAGDGTVLDCFGSSVALSGNTGLVGAFLDDTVGGVNTGGAYVFVRSGTTWSQQAQLVPNNGALDDNFGRSVALSGSTALVSASLDDTPGATDAGAAFVFERGASGWNCQAKLAASDGASGDYFGSSVALNGNTALVGATFGNSPGGGNSGSAYVFVRNGVNWSQQAKLTASDAALSDFFGSAVALSGESALIGASTDDSSTGSAYVFVRAGGVWTQQAKLVAADRAAGDQFGHSVALLGDTALVGARYADTAAGSKAGGAYVYVRSGTVWSQQTKLTATVGASANDQFGSAVALGVDTALVGAPLNSTAGGAGAGSTYVFVRGGTTWSQQANLTASDGRPDARFGDAVAISGSTALIGSPRNLAFADDPFPGGAYLFSRSGTAWSQQLRLTAGVDSAAHDGFGIAAAIDADMALVGASQTNNGGQSAGGAYVFLIGELPAITTQPVSRTVVPGAAVAFTVAAAGKVPLRYQWRKDGTEITGATGTTYSIASAAVAHQGVYDVVVSNIGGTATSAAATLTVNALSQFGRQFPGALADAQGFLIVNLSPAGLLHGWRFVGEQQWRASGVPAGGLTTGDRDIEFRPVPGHIHPPNEAVSVISGEAASLVARDYYETTVAGSGGLTVALKPDSITTGPNRAQWRLLGETDAQWRDSGASLSGLIPGSYLIECKPVTGRVTPPYANAIISGGQPAAPTITYFLPDATVGTPPAVLAFESVTGDTTRPYAFVGQLRSSVGSSSGFVVKPRVVATAAHVVWDDGTLSAVQGLQWLFQRHRGLYEPKAVLPRGFYLFDDYAAQRVIDNSPGQSSPQSQHRDVAAIYFNEEAGRGGHGGFLASDQTSNEFLLSSANKLLVGYPVDGIAATSQGRMHATSPANLVFSAAFGRTYTTTGIRSSGGNSGGPLCVQFENGSYYPAAIYLGGNAQTVVRAIDSGVIDLFNRAEVSSNGGGNNTGGGITHTGLTPVGSPSSPGALQVMIQPAGAVSAGAGWRLSPESGFRVSGALKGGLNAGSYVLQLATVAGYQAPAQQNIVVVGGQLATLTYTYAAQASAQESWRQTHFGSSANSGSGADSADPDGDGFNNLAEYTAGTNPVLSGDCFRAQNPTRGTGTFSLSTAGRAGRTYVLELSTGLTAGTWTSVATQGPLGADATVTLTDSASPAGSAFYRIRVTGP